MRVNLWNSYTGALVFHYLCYVFMQILALMGEQVRGPSLPDKLHSLIPPMRQFDIWNNQIWIFELMFFLIILTIYERKAAITYLRVGGVVSVVRGIFIFMTTLGPPSVINTGYEENQFLNVMAWDSDYLLKFLIPVGGIFGHEKTVFYLTQDLFFSGHTASTFLLILVAYKKKYLFLLSIIYHIQTIFFLVITHEHYTIDILGAYFIVFAIYETMKKNELLV